MFQKSKSKKAKEMLQNGVYNMFDPFDVKLKCSYSCEPIWTNQYDKEPKMNKETIYKVNEMFESIQGEGYYAGEPVIFIRLAGCSMGCEWCDTKYCQEVHYKLTAEQILQHIEKNFVKKRIVISGGEPFEQNLDDLVRALAEKHYSISIETNGAEDIDDFVKASSWITVSPKKHVLESSLRKADEIKLVISNEMDIDRAKRIMSHYSNANFYLQPESGKEEATNLCVYTCIQDPRFKLSVQVHKLIDIK